MNELWLAFASGLLGGFAAGGTSVLLFLRWAWWLPLLVR